MRKKTASAKKPAAKAKRPAKKPAKRTKKKTAPASVLPDAIQPDFGPSIQGSELIAGIKPSLAQEADIQSAIQWAHRFPRSEESARRKLLESCSVFSFADDASFEFLRDGKTVIGPSVNLAREFARVWGNIRYGCKVIADDDDSRSIYGWAWDLENNIFEEAPDVFKKLVIDATSGKTVVPDERQLRSLTNRQAAMAIRNCIVHLMPPVLLTEVMQRIEKTLDEEAAKDPLGHVRDLTAAFLTINVTTSDLEGFMGHSMDKITAADVQKLRRIYKTIKGSDAKWTDYTGGIKATVTPSAETAAAFGGATGTIAERPTDAGQRPKLPDHLRPKNDDDRQIDKYLLDTVPTLTSADDLDAIAAALPGLRIPKTSLQSIVKALADQHDAINEAAVGSSDVTPEDVDRVYGNISEANSETALNLVEEAWLKIADQYPDYVDEIADAIRGRRTEISPTVNEAHGE